MMLILGSLAIGAVVGATMTMPRLIQDRLGLLLNTTLYLMLAALGAQVGANYELMNKLPEIGWRAFLLAALAVAGSLAALFAAVRIFRLSDPEGDQE